MGFFLCGHCGQDKEGPVDELTICPSCKAIGAWVPEYSRRPVKRPSFDEWLAMQNEDEDD